MSSNTYHIKIEGLVQGVGFRPFVYKLARHFRLGGWVNNTTEGVHVKFSADKKTAIEFYENLITNPPSLSKITSHSITEINFENYSSFEIAESEPGDNPKLMLTPDFAICANCKSELNDSNNRRHQYPFITCTQCGPRYSNITTLPYDRTNTTMHSFEMCASCKTEYNNPEDRRHHSQTNSCSECAIVMEMFDASGHKLSYDNTAIINKICDALNTGKLIAVKGIGGYLLLTDAGNAESIKTLRERKHRPFKPFALMFPSIDSIKQIFHLEECDEISLKSVAAPIVLINFRNSGENYVCIHEIAPGLSKLGVMLPYTPLFELILQKFGKPVIATSANVSDSPIIYNDEEALRSLSSVADYIVTNNREIVIPQDDSVIQFTTLTNQQIIIRRSRGMAPSYFNYDCKTSETILATGALLKSTFTYVNNRNTFISQYLGSTESYEAQETYTKAVQHFFKLFGSEPAIILTDKHPQYFSNLFAKKLGEELRIKVQEIQHHKAHFAAVLAENNLIHSKQIHRNGLSKQETILGVIWDGTGLGDDGNIWGGEFFKYENNAIDRYGHFDYFPYILGDKMAREPRISALAACKSVEEKTEFLRDKFTQTEWTIYNTMLQKSSISPSTVTLKEKLLCSSVGRIFDAVSSMLGLLDKQTYEGEAAMLLQEQALSYFENFGWNMTESYFEKKINHRNIPTGVLMNGIINDIQRRESIQFIAAKFHYSLVQLVDSVADCAGTNKIAFSGGVFLNSVFVDLLQYHLGSRYQLYFHKNLSPNDENISFGQVVYYDNKIDKKEKINAEFETLQSVEKLEN